MSHPDQENLSTQPFMAHLLELRRRLMWSFGALIVASIVAYIYVQPIYGFLVQPLADAMGTDGTQRLIYTDLTEAFFTYMKVSLFTGMFVSLPIILAQIWMFVAPGLYKRERGTFFAFLFATPTLFYLGGALVYFVILPIAWTFFLSFQSSGAETVLPIQLEARVGEYLDLVMVLMIAFGLAFELPVILMVLARVGIVNADMLAKRRKYAVIAAFVVAAPLTPPDIVSQTCMAIPLLGLYEISIFLMRRLMPVRTEATPQPAEPPYDRAD